MENIQLPMSIGTLIGLISFFIHQTYKFSNMKNAIDNRQNLAEKDLEDLKRSRDNVVVKITKLETKQNKTEVTLGKIESFMKSSTETLDRIKKKLD